MYNKTCVHIIIRDKFTSGYINFLKEYDFGWNHVFYTFENAHELNLKNSDNVNIVSSYNCIPAQILESADKVVLAAFFDEALSLLKYSRDIWNKTYIQFWGGDIYRFRNKRKGFINRIKQMIIWNLVRFSIKKAAGVLTLVEGDYTAIENIFNVRDIKHQVVQVPDDFYEINHIDYKEIKKKENYYGNKRIIVGNSATIENGHLEIFKILKDKIDIKTDVLVPLSYGDEKYRDIVISEGKELLKEHFLPVVEFMNRDKYIGLLSTCDVAIFNNNRQQATGNIILLANLGKKLYLRKDTSMWEFFTNLGFVLHDVEDLHKESIEEILTLNHCEELQNYKALKQMEEDAIEEWRIFLNR